MTTGNRKINLFLKKFLTQQQFSANFLDYLHNQSLQNLSLQYPESGIFEGGVLSGVSSDQFKVSIPTSATNGQGRLLQLDPAYAFVTFENELGVDYSVGLRFNEISQETEVNVRTGEIEYSFFEEAIGELAEPNSVVDNGSSLTLILDNVFESGVNHGGRQVMVYLKRAVAQADAFFIGTSSWNGTNNFLDTTNILGQTAGLVSTDTSDYQIFAFGPTVRRNTDLSLDPNVAFLGTVEGAGAGNTPSTFDQTGINLLFPPGDLGPAIDEVKSFLTGGGLVTWDLTAQELTWAEPLKVIMPNKPHNFDIAATTVNSIADGDILYIQAALPGGTKPIIKTTANSMPDVATNYPIAIREGNNLYFRDGALELKGVAGSDTSGRINDITQDLLDYMGATDESDSDPFYTSVPLFTPSTIAQGDNLTLAIDKLNASLSSFLTNTPKQEEFLVGVGGQQIFNIAGFTFDADNAIFDIEAFIDGRRVVQDPAGGTARDFRKTSTSQVTFSFVVPEGRTVTFWKQGFVNGGIFAPIPGQLWSDPVDASPIPNSDIAHDLGSAARRFREAHIESLFANNLIFQSNIGALKRIKVLKSTTVAGAAGQPVAKAATGQVVLAGSDAVPGKRYTGIALEAWIAGGSVKTLLPGLNIPGILTGQGFTTGDEIYVGETPGTFTNNPGAFTGLNDDTIKVGVADCAEDTVSGIATDLILFSDIEARA